MKGKIDIPKGKVLTTFPCVGVRCTYQVAEGVHALRLNNDTVILQDQKRVRKFKIAGFTEEGTPSFLLREV